jgi:hypothetical protein
MFHELFQILICLLLLIHHMWSIAGSENILGQTVIGKGKRLTNCIFLFQLKSDYIISLLGCPTNFFFT